MICISLDYNIIATINFSNNRCINDLSRYIKKILFIWIIEKQPDFIAIEILVALQAYARDIFILHTLSQNKEFKADIFFFQKTTSILIKNSKILLIYINCKGFK